MTLGMFYSFASETFCKDSLLDEYSNYFYYSDKVFGKTGDGVERCGAMCQSTARAGFVGFTLGEGKCYCLYDRSYDLPVGIGEAVASTSTAYTGSGEIRRVDWKMNTGRWRTPSNFICYKALVSL